MNQSDQRILSRIRKLLALSESPFEAEAASALGKANELLLAHGIDQGVVAAGNPKIVDRVASEGGEISPWEIRLARCVGGATLCDVILVTEEYRRELRFVGREVHVVSAGVLFDYLHEAIERRAAMFREAIDDLESFTMGMVESVTAKLPVLDTTRGATGSTASRGTGSAQKREIVVFTERVEGENRAYVADRYGEPEEHTDYYGVDPNSFGLGKGIGRKIPVHRQIGRKS